MNDFSLTDDDFDWYVKGLAHLIDCDCYDAEEALQIAELLKKTELLVNPARALEHLAKEWDVPVNETDMEL